MLQHTHTHLDNSDTQIALHMTLFQQTPGDPRILSFTNRDKLSLRTHTHTAPAVLSPIVCFHSDGQRLAATATSTLWSREMFNAHGNFYGERERSIVENSVWTYAM